MTFQVSSPDFISSEVLAFFYIILGAAAYIGHTGQYHARTVALLTYCRCCMIVAVCRVVYFGVPPDAWQQANEVPQSAARWSTPWWLNFVQFIFFVVPNFASAFEYFVIIFIWRQAHNELRKSATTRPSRLIRGILIVYGVYQLALLTMYFFLSFYDVLAAHSVMGVSISLVLFSSFVYYWLKLRGALSDVANRAKSTHLLLTPSVTVARDASGSGDAQSAELHVVVPPSAEVDHVVASAQRKVARISALSFVCAACALLRAAVELYQLTCVSSSTPHFADSSWWAVIFVYYTFAEVFTGLAVLTILRKPSSNADAASSGGGKTNTAGVGGAYALSGGRPPPLSALRGGYHGGYAAVASQ
jgi:hypothetical protein